MLILKATEDFSYGEFYKLKNLIRYNQNKNNDGIVYKGDEFECDEETAKYIMGGNRFKTSYAEIKEIIPEKTEKVEKQEKKRNTKKVDKKK